MLHRSGGSLRLVLLGLALPIPCLAQNNPAPGVTLSSTSAYFGNQPVGARTSPQTITLKNTGAASLMLASIAIASGDSGDFALDSAGTCPANGGTLAVGASCTILATFRPTEWGSRSGALAITDNAPGSPQSASLSGVGQDFEMDGAWTSAIGPDGHGGTTISVTGSTSATIRRGGTARFSIRISPRGGFNHTLSLECGGAPPYSTCSVTPSTVTLDGSRTELVRMTISTTSPSVSPPPTGNPPPGFGRFPWVIWLSLLGFLMLAVLARRKGRRFRLAPAASLLLATLWISSNACAPREPTPGTTLGIYTVSVVATMTPSSDTASLTHVFSLTLNVT